MPLTKRTKKFITKNLAGEIQRRKERQKWGKWKGKKEEANEEVENENEEVENGKIDLFALKIFY